MSRTLCKIFKEIGSVVFELKFLKFLKREEEEAENMHYLKGEKLKLD